MCVHSSTNNNNNNPKTSVTGCVYISLIAVFCARWPFVRCLSVSMFGFSSRRRRRRCHRESLPANMRLRVGRCPFPFPKMPVVHTKYRRAPAGTTYAARRKKKVQTPFKKSNNHNRIWCGRVCVCVCARRGSLNGVCARRRRSVYIIYCYYCVPRKRRRRPQRISCVMLSNKQYATSHCLLMSLCMCIRREVEGDNRRGRVRPVCVI